MSRFFEEKQAAAILKHGILRRYLAVFASKTGVNAPNNRVVYLDGYAGPGIYDDSKPGSPALAQQTASELARTRSLEGIYVEEKKENAAKLRDFLVTTSHVHTVLEGSIEDRLDEALAIAGDDAPMLAFFDPFGLGVPMRDLEKVFARAKKRLGRREGPPTEILLNFSYPGIRRTAGQLNAESDNAAYLKARETILANVDATLAVTTGPEGDVDLWWREIATNRPDGWVEKIAHGYAERLGNTVAAGWYRVPVSNRVGGATVYELMLLTQYSEQGLWNFHENVSLATAEYRAYCRANQDEDDQMLLDLDEAAWVAEIKRVVRERLKQGEFVVKRLEAVGLEVYGSTLGVARAKHVREAVKQLYAEGVTNCDGKGEVQDLLITVGDGTPRVASKKSRKKL